MSNKKSSSLGSNPLGASIFSQTEKTNQAKETRIKKQESRFLEKTEKEKVNLRLSLDLNDWLDNLIKQGKRTHGSKIPKEIWVQAALEFFRSLPVDWESIDSVESLAEELKNLESRLNE